MQSQDPVCSASATTINGGFIQAGRQRTGDKPSSPFGRRQSRAFVQTPGRQMENCAGKTVTVTNKAKTYRWTFADVRQPADDLLIDAQGRR